MRPFSANLPALGNLTKKGIERAKVTLMSATTRDFSTVDLKEDPKLRDLLDFLDNLKNYEKSGVPKGAGTDSSDGFDLGRMRRLMERLGNPHSKFKVCIQFLGYVCLGAFFSWKMEMGDIFLVFLLF